MSAPVALQPPGPGWGGGGGGAEDDVQLGGGAGAEPQHQQQHRTPLPAPRHFLVPAPDCCSRVNTCRLFIQNPGFPARAPGPRPIFATYLLLKC